MMFVVLMMMDIAECNTKKKKKKGIHLRYQTSRPCLLKEKQRQSITQCPNGQTFSSVTQNQILYYTRIQLHSWQIFSYLTICAVGFGECLWQLRMYESHVIKQGPDLFAGTGHEPSPGTRTQHALMCTPGTQRGLVRRQTGPVNTLWIFLTVHWPTNAVAHRDLSRYALWPVHHCH